jgi:hypothetical protein
MTNEKQSGKMELSGMVPATCVEVRRKVIGMSEMRRLYDGRRVMGVINGAEAKSEAGRRRSCEPSFKSKGRPGHETSDRAVSAFTEFVGERHGRLRKSEAP